MPAAPSTTTTASAPSERRSSSPRISASSASRPWNSRAGTVAIRSSRRAYPDLSGSFQIAGSCDAQATPACPNWSSQKLNEGSGRSEWSAQHRSRSRRLGRWVLLERRHRAPPGRGLPGAGAAVPADLHSQTTSHGCARCSSSRTAHDRRRDTPTAVRFMTALGSDAPNVAGLVYVAAFGLGRGRVARGASLAGTCHAVACASLHRLARLRLALRGRLRQPLRRRRRNRNTPVFLYAVQQALASSAFTDVMGERRGSRCRPGTSSRRNDEAIPPDAERQFAARMGATTVEIPASHVAMVSHPGEVVDLIEKAAESVGAATAPLTSYEKGRTHVSHGSRFDPASHGRQRGRVRVPRLR